MKKLIYLLICISVLSCTKEQTQNSKTQSLKSDRLVFKDFTEFRKTYSNLTKVTSTNDLQFWAQEKNHSTLLYDTTLRNYSPSLRTILNKDSEFQVNDSIVWFNPKTGNLYTYAKNATFINDLKAHPELYTRRGFFTSREIRSSSKGGHVPLNGYFGAYISPNFSQYYRKDACDGNLINTGGGTRKWVTELRDETYWSGTYWESFLFLVIKLEWYSRRTGWHEASELRDIEFSISGSVSFVCYSGVLDIYNFPIYPNFSGKCSDNPPNPVSMNQWFNQAIVQYPTMTVPSSNTYWDVDISGWVYQHVLGNSDTYDPYTEYVDWQ